MKTTVYLTIDTESSMGGAWADPEREPVPAERHVFCRAAGHEYGVPLIVDEFDGRGMRGTFFVETLATHVLGEADTRSVTDFLLERGQDVQAHVHPTFRHYRDYLALRDQGRAPDDPWECDQLSAHDEDTQRDLLRDGLDLLEGCTGRRATVFRAGGFAADRRTLRILGELGVRIDSSYNPIYRESNRSFPDDPPAVNQVECLEGVWEVPITVARTTLPEGVGLKPADVTAISSAEMESLLGQAHAGGMRHVVTIFHCFSTVKPRDVGYTALRPNRLVIRRLQRLLDFLAANDERFEVRTLGDLAETTTALEGEQPAVVPDLGFWRPAARKVVQAVNNLYWT